MKCSLKDLPITKEKPQRVSRGTDWGGMYVYAGETLQTIDHAPSLTGTPDDRCQCPHWGYILKGQMRFNVAGQVELFKERFVLSSTRTYSDL